MKLSEVLKKDWPEKKEIEGDYRDCYSCSKNEEDYENGYNTALTSCDREIDREALAKYIKASRSMYRWEIRDKQIGDEIQDEYEFIANSIISTMPKWLKRTE